MNILYLTIPVSIALAAFFVVAFFRAVKNGQFSDLETPAHLVLDDLASNENKNKEGEGNGQLG